MLFLFGVTSHKISSPIFALCLLSSHLIFSLKDYVCLGAIKATLKTRTSLKIKLQGLGLPECEILPGGWLSYHMKDSIVASTQRALSNGQTFLTSSTTYPCDS